ncbi:kinase-like domain-containing protein, partial [Leptodontidium sp. 2 PMI_412]
IQKDFENEVGILKNLDHTHLVKIVSSYTDPEFVAMLMEPVASMSLKDYLSSRGTSAELFESEREQFRCYYGCLAHALSYLHESKVRHKDIKPSNILIGQKLEIYIADFGSATEFSDENSMTMGSARARTFRYQSPELFRGAKRGRSSDVWSLGVTFLEMTT